MTDDQTFESIASMPYIRALADRGTKFTNYHASFPLCCPSRATTLTGQYAHHHGVWRNGGPEGGYTAFEPGAGNSLSVWLQDAGYKTMMVGKFLNGYDVGDGVPPGWDRWRVWNRSTDGNSRYHDVPLVYEDGTVHQTTGYSTLTYRKQATQLVDESADGQPWFMWLAFNAPHSSMDADPDDLPQRPSPSPAVQDRDAFEGTKAPAFGRALFNEADVSDKPRFLATLPKMSPAMVRAVNESYSQQLETLQSVDRAIGGIEARLAATGQLGNTVIAFTSDNGLYYGEHRIAAGKNSAYTASSRLPLVVAGPGFGSAVVDGSPRLNTDLAPTFLDLASATPGRAMDGVSLRPVGAGEAAVVVRGPDAVLLRRGPLQRRAILSHSAAALVLRPLRVSPTAPSGSSSTTSSRIGTCSGTCIGTRPTTRASRLCAARWRRWPGMSSRGGPPTRTDAG